VVSPDGEALPSLNSEKKTLRLTAMPGSLVGENESLENAVQHELKKQVLI
jgi:ADP-ribose pyrophosphatase YjhB (NUDIX family)